MESKGEMFKRHKQSSNISHIKVKMLEKPSTKLVYSRAKYKFINLTPVLPAAAGMRPLHSSITQIMSSYTCKQTKEVVTHSNFIPNSKSCSTLREMKD